MEGTMKVIVGLDDSVHSEAVIRYIVGATWPKDARFVIVSAAPVYVGPGEATSPGVIEHLVEAQRKYHHGLAEKAAVELRQSGFTAEARALHGDPRAVLVDEASRERADLIVVGSHGRTGIKRLLLGSVASHVATHAPCSVLVVKTPR